MLPVTAGSVVLAYNLEGVEQLRLSREVYASIFLGEITRWSDPRIQKDNPGARLPDQPITVMRRSDGSGTTFVFTQHLSAIDERWRKGPGTGKSVDWPVGVGGRKNDGVAALLKQTPGAIGYVEFAYAVLTKLPMAQLENKSGAYITPNLESASVALSSVELPSDFRAWVPDPQGPKAYPIVTYTWLLVRTDYADDSKAAALRKLVEYCVGAGAPIARSLHYVPLPAAVVSAVRRAAQSIQ